MTNRSAILRTGVLVSLTALVVFACTPTEPTGTTGASTTTVGTTAPGPGTTQPSGTTTSEVKPAPARGGTLVMGLSNESSSGWTPGLSVWAVSGQQVVRAMYDPLMILDANGDAVPNLASDVTSNSDATEWTITAREGVVFHDGTPFDGKALKANLDACRMSRVRGATLAGIQFVTLVDDMTVRVIMDAPWAAFDKLLTGATAQTQCAYMIAPSQWADEEGPSHPIGTGPFRLVSWDLNDKTVLEANPDYWKTDPDGNQLPYLDGIEFRIIPDEQARRAALLNGEIDVMATDDPSVMLQLKDDGTAGAIQYHETTAYEAGEGLLFNTANPPLDNVEVRRAIAQAINVAQILAIDGGILQEANGPFPPGTSGYLEDAGKPAYDPDAARATLASVAPEGIRPLTLTTGNDQRSLNIAQIVQAMLGDVGIEVTINALEQQQTGTAYVTGDFDIYASIGFPATDADQNRVYWGSQASCPVGDVCLNGGRIEDPVVDELLATIHSVSDPQARAQAGEELTKRLNQQVYFVWLSWTQFAFGYGNAVQDLFNPTTPEGGPAAPIIHAVFNPAQVWKD